MSDRFELREWVMNTFGDGRRVPCVGCGLMLERRFLTLDRYPIPGFMGGTYRRDNVRPMCGPCNHGNEHTPSREWVLEYATEHGITLRTHQAAPQYSSEWYREHRQSHRAPLTQTIGEACDC